MHLWEKYTYVCVFHSFLIVFSFAVTLSESQDKPLFNPEEEIKYTKIFLFI